MCDDSALSPFVSFCLPWLFLGVRAEMILLCLPLSPLFLMAQNGRQRLSRFAGNRNIKLSLLFGGDAGVTCSA